MADRPCATSARYVTLATAGAGGSLPILFASGPMGDALLSTGLLTLAGSTAATMAPILPVRVSGIDVRETLHRVDTGEYGSSAGRTITVANRLGEPLGTITMHWLVAPDGFEATPSASPPATELDAATSQRFVMSDGVLRFQDRAGSGMRFFGAGRTYPTQIDGSTFLVFAGAAVVLEGFGTLKSLRGSLTIAGEIAARSLVSLTVSGRFDEDGPFQAVARLTPMIDSADDAPNATVITLIGESDGTSAGGDCEEQLRSVRIDTDLANGSHPRSLLQPGPEAGRAAGPLRFDPAERRCAVRLAEGRRAFTFVREGQTIAAIEADALEGTAFRDPHAGPEAARVIAYGPLSHGTGALEGAGGVLTLDTAVASAGAAASIYTLWLVDPQRRFRPPSVIRSSETGVPSQAPASKASDPVLSHVDETLAGGSAMLAWFRRKEETGDYAEGFDVAAGTGITESFGFFDSVAIGGTNVPVMGIVREMFYDRERSATIDDIRPQLEAFVLRYFIRVCGGYRQIYFKRADGDVEAFAFADQSAVVDLREIGTRYRWVVLKADAVTSDLAFAPPGFETPMLEVPLQLPAYVVIGPEFVTAAAEPRKGVAAEYGFGYALMPWGNFHSAIRTVRFRLLSTGEIRVQATLVMNRLDRLTAVDLDPIGWSMHIADRVTFHMASRLMSPVLALTDRLPLRASGVDPLAASIRMANAITGGAAAKRFGISKAVLEKRMLLQHFTQHEEMLHRSLQVWRMMPDWTAEEQLPEYCRKGLA